MLYCGSFVSAERADEVFRLTAQQYLGRIFMATASAYSVGAVQFRLERRGNNAQLAITVI